MPSSVIGRWISGSSTVARAARTRSSVGSVVGDCHATMLRGATGRRAAADWRRRAASAAGLARLGRRCARTPRPAGSARSGGSRGWRPRPGRCAARRSRGPGTRCPRSGARLGCGPAPAGSGRGRPAGSARAGSAARRSEACRDSIRVRNSEGVRVEPRAAAGQRVPAEPHDDQRGHVDDELPGAQEAGDPLRQPSEGLRVPIGPAAGRRARRVRLVQAGPAAARSSRSPRSRSRGVLASARPAAGSSSGRASRRQQVVQHVVHRHRADQPVVAVHDRIATRL